MRRGAEQDLDELAELGDALARMHHELDKDRFFYGVRFEQGYRWWFAQELKNADACFFVVDAPATSGARAPRLAGYVYGRLEERNWADLLDAHAALVDIHVRTPFRKGDVGRALVDAFCAWAAKRRAPRVVLSTAAKNAGAQKFFARVGFRPTMIEMTRETSD